MAVQEVAVQYGPPKPVERSRLLIRRRATTEEDDRAGTAIGQPAGDVQPDVTKPAGDDIAPIAADGPNLAPGISARDTVKLAAEPPPVPIRELPTVGPEQVLGQQGIAVLARIGIDRDHRNLRAFGLGRPDQS